MIILTLILFSVVDGTNDHEAYTFYNWGGIDIFCYFSHHLVTIPPLGWINIGHAHGVQVIGMCLEVPTFFISHLHLYTEQQKKIFSSLRRFL